jgi:cobalt-zinc-cadmium efflux system outer membrane protein
MKKTLLILILATLFTAATAQNISYGEYMERVFKNNIALTAKRMDIEIADAAVTGSQVYNDPSIALTYTNNEDWRTGLGQGIELELGRTFTFGVRRSRIDLAES